MKANGFTLVELMVALLIFGMLAAAGVALFSFSVRAQDVADDRLAALAQVRRTGALLTADLAQAAPRLSRDETGTVHRAFEGGTGQGPGVAIALVRRGWDNLDQADRPSIQKVEYRLAGDRLERTGYRFVDGAAPPAPIILVDRVRALRLRYRDDKGEWRDRWDPDQPAPMPVAVEMLLTVGEDAPVRQLFLVGTGW